MDERWTCSSCSRQNESWAISCAGCGNLRADLSVAGPQSEVPGTTPQSAAVPPADVPPPAPTWPAAVPPAGVPQPAPTWPSAANDAPTSATDAWSPPVPGPDVAPPTPPASVPFWQRLPLGWIIVGVLVFGGAIAGLIFNASRDSSGEITKAGDLQAADLRVGDCFDLKDPEAEELEDVTGLPCASEHQYEVFHVGAMPEGDFPTDDAFLAWLDANCVPAFDAYVGMAYDTSQLNFSWLQPTPDLWNDGDRSIQCSLFDPNDDRVTGSLKGAAR
jgi:hypothetical protein